MKLLRNLITAAVFVFVIWALLPGKASAEGEYTVHYETYGKLEQDVELPDKSVSWDDADLGARVSSSDFKSQYSFVNWYVDETFTTEYTKETKYSSLASGDTSVTSVTLPVAVATNSSPSRREPIVTITALLKCAVPS